MRDGREGINKAISDYEEDIRIKGGEDIKDCKLSDEDKELIEYGYIQCMLQIGYDIATKSESFISGLQELSKFESFISEGYTEDSLRETIHSLRKENIKLRQENL